MSKAIYIIQFELNGLLCVSTMQLWHINFLLFHLGTAVLHNTCLFQRDGSKLPFSKLCKQDSASLLCSSNQHNPSHSFPNSIQEIWTIHTRFKTHVVFLGHRAVLIHMCVYDNTCILSSVWRCEPTGCWDQWASRCYNLQWKCVFCQLQKRAHMPSAWLETRQAVSASPSSLNLHVEESAWATLSI